MSLLKTSFIWTNIYPHRFQKRRKSMSDCCSKQILLFASQQIISRRYMLKFYVKECIKMLLILEMLWLLKSEDLESSVYRYCGHLCNRQKNFTHRGLRLNFLLCLWSHWNRPLSHNLHIGYVLLYYPNYRFLGLILVSSVQHGVRSGDFKGHSTKPRSSIQ